MIKNESLINIMIYIIIMFILYVQPETPQADEFYKQQAASYKSRAYGERDAGFDLYSEAAVIEGGTKAKKVGQQAKVAVYDTAREHFRAYWMIPRSSISKTPLRLANSLGLIDAGYRGTLIAAVDNQPAEPFTINLNDRLFQVVNSELLPWDAIEIVSVIPGGETLRGEGGFGSTGTGGVRHQHPISGYWE
jgi:dUTP pyrophosphatase